MLGEQAEKTRMRLWRTDDPLLSGGSSVEEMLEAGDDIGFYMGQQVVEEAAMLRPAAATRPRPPRRWLLSECLATAQGVR